MTIVLTGGSGFIGTELAKALLAAQHTVIIVDIKAPSFTHEKLFFIQCNLSTQALPYNVLDRTDAVINLVGSPIIKKWTPEIKKEIYDSRIESSKRIVESIANASIRPTVCITASAIGYYGDTGDGSVDEQSPKGEGYLSDVVRDWESTIKGVEAYGVRVVYIRTAPVLGNGGLLLMLRQTMRFGFLLHFAKKDFNFSWVYHQDVINAYLFALETSTLQGVVNLSAPEATTGRTFISALAKSFHKIVLGSTPVWLTKILFGELHHELVKNSHVIPQRLIDKGFVFEYPTLAHALHSAAHRTKTHKKK